MIDTADERSKALTAFCKARAVRPSNRPRAPPVSSAFFAQTALKRWEAERQRRKAIADQLFAQLRNAEREWNASLPANSPVDSYDDVDMSPVMISVEETASTIRWRKAATTDQSTTPPASTTISRMATRA